MHTVKIAIIGDYNFTFNAHHATNLALDHASNFLDVDVNYYWIRVSEVAQQKIAFFDQYDAFWIAPGPFLNPFFLIFSNKRYDMCVLWGLLIYYRKGRLVSVCERVEYWQISGKLTILILQASPTHSLLRISPRFSVKKMLHGEWGFGTDYEESSSFYYNSVPKDSV